MLPLQHARGTGVPPADRLYASAQGFDYFPFSLSPKRSPSVVLASVSFMCSR